MNEFSLIQRYFTRPGRHTLLSIGDDAALIQPGSDQCLAVSADMLVAGRHFLTDTDPYRLGWKTLAVNLSDMAAMGAVPRWAMLSLALPAADAGWLQAFADGFFALAERFDVDLIGGDTTSGPLNLSVQIMGEVPAGQALRRDGARLGDDIWVSGDIGEAALGLAHLQGGVVLAEAARMAAIARLEQPSPRIELGLALRGIAHSAIDLSDGLLGDLGHILERSGCGARIDVAALPASDCLAPLLRSEPGWDYQLAGGDDYELCFTAPPARREQVVALQQALSLKLTRIGEITATGLEVRAPDGQLHQPKRHSFDHFRA